MESLLLLGKGNMVPLWDSLLSSSPRKMTIRSRRGCGVAKEPVNRQMSPGRLAPRPFSKDLLSVRILLCWFNGPASRRYWPSCSTQYLKKHSVASIVSGQYGGFPPGFRQIPKACALPKPYRADPKPIDCFLEAR